MGFFLRISHWVFFNGFRNGFFFYGFRNGFFYGFCNGVFSYDFAMGFWLFDFYIRLFGSQKSVPYSTHHHGSVNTSTTNAPIKNRTKALRYNLPCANGIKNLN